MGEKRECLRRHHDAENCRGSITRRWTEHGTAIDECDHHTTESLQRNQEIQERYPDSSEPPSWWLSQGGESYAGERWDDDY